MKKMKKPNLTKQQRYNCYKKVYRRVVSDFEHELLFQLGVCVHLKNASMDLYGIKVGIADILHDFPEFGIFKPPRKKIYQLWWKARSRRRIKVLELCMGQTKRKPRSKKEEQQ